MIYSLPRSWRCLEKSSNYLHLHSLTWGIQFDLPSSVSSWNGASQLRSSPTTRFEKQKYFWMFSTRWIVLRSKYFAVIYFMLFWKRGFFLFPIFYALGLWNGLADPGSTCKNFAVRWKAEHLDSPLLLPNKQTIFRTNKHTFQVTVKPEKHLCLACYSTGIGTINKYINPAGQSSNCWSLMRHQLGCGAQK